jgi:hypothetical protein
MAAEKRKLTFEGIPFIVEIEPGHQVTCRPTCPNCGNSVEQRAIPGQDAMLICLSRNKGCVNPVKAFRAETEMRDFLTMAGAEFEKWLRP